MNTTTTTVRNDIRLDCNLISILKLMDFYSNKKVIVVDMSSFTYDIKFIGEFYDVPQDLFEAKVFSLEPVNVRKYMSEYAWHLKTTDDDKINESLLFEGIEDAIVINCTM